MAAIFDCLLQKKKKNRTRIVNHQVNHHSLAFLTPLAGTDIYKSSVFPQTIRDWNFPKDPLTSTSECAEDPVTMFTSLVRARD